MRFFSRPEGSILLVCTANICRSPMAEGVLRLELEKQELHSKTRVDSAGTHATQPGHRADPRAQKVCAREGIDLRKCRARQVKAQDFGQFDHILAMDMRNHQWLLENCPEPMKDRISLLGVWAQDEKLVEIPDPYYGNLTGFEEVLKMLRVAISGFLRQIE